MSANQSDPQFKLRLPQALKERVEVSAAEHKRSINADIVARLEASLDGDGGHSPYARATAQAQQESLRALADDLAAIVEDLDRVVGHLDAEAWRSGAYTILEDDRTQSPGKRYEPGSPQFSSWVAGRAFAVAAELKRAARPAQTSSHEPGGEVETR